MGWLLAILGWIKELITVLPLGIRRYFTVRNLLDENAALKAENKDLQAKEKVSQAEIEILRKEKQELEKMVHSKDPPVDTDFEL